MSNNANRVNNPMKVITGPDTRWSYANVWEPKSINGGTPKYSVSLIIPKSDTKTVAKIKAAIEAAYQEGQSKLKGNSKSVPPLAAIKTPLRDGDIAAVEQTYKAAVELFAMLCEKYGLDPLADGVIVSHKEGYVRGIATNHGDPEHLWTQLGTSYTMDTFRKAVKAEMDKSKLDNTPASWSKESVEWAVAEGLMAGGTNGDLMLRSPITREQFCVMLKRYHDFCGKQNNQKSTY